MSVSSLKRHFSRLIEVLYLKWVEEPLELKGVGEPQVGRRTSNQKYLFRKLIRESTSHCFPFELIKLFFYRTILSRRQ